MRLTTVFVMATFFVATISSAKEPTFKIQCVTTPPTSSFEMISDGENVTLKMYHHNGIQYMPIHRGIITSHDLSLLQQRSEVLLRLPTYLEFKTPVNDCKFYSDFKTRCFGRTESKQGDVLVDSFYFYSHKVVTEIGGYDPFVATGISLDLTIDKKTYSIPMSYNEGECRKISE